MPSQSGLLRIKRKTIIYFVVLLVTLASVTPALADYLGPNRTFTETTSACKVVLYECQNVSTRGWRYKAVDDWSCSNESKPWKSYPSQPSSQGCFEATAGDQYWEKENILQEVVNTYPPATVNSSLQNCTLQNGWCATAPTLVISGNEPLSGYSIDAIEGSLNGKIFACSGPSCSVALNQGDNSFTYWALSSWGDSSTMGMLTAKVDSQLPSITGAFTGTLGLDGWYISPVSFAGNASDATSGLASFTCSLDGATLSSCNSIAVNSEGVHALVLAARDQAGNTRVITQNVSLDTLNPTLIASLNGTMGSNNWYTAAKLNAAASDTMPGSGLADFEYNLDNDSWKGFPASGSLDLPEGRHTVDLRAADNAGHAVSTSKSFWLDVAAPSLVLEPAGILGSNNWYTTPLNLAVAASDSTSGIAILEYNLNNSGWVAYTTDLTLPDGTHNISFWAQDQAGLVNQMDRIYRIDTRPPQIAGSINGIPGRNGWYVSDVTLSASAADPSPGSGMDAFTYNLNSAGEVPFTDVLTLKDGQHKIRINVRDQAGLSHFTEQTIKVDTIRPSLSIHTALPGWIKGDVTLSGTASDDGSGLSTVEISTDGGQSWQAVTGSTSWSYNWGTVTSLDGSRNVHVRVVDNSGLTSEKIVNVGVDNHAPNISIPNSWFQWDTISLDVWDNHSGLAEVQIEISDPDGRWQKRIIELHPAQFPLNFKWDRRLGDDTVAPLGTYDVKVTAVDKLGNSTRRNASIQVLLGILPAGPTATLQPLSRAELTPTPIYTAPSISSPAATEMSFVSVFGAIEPTPQATAAPSSMPAPRATPDQTTVLDWLESIFVPDSKSTQSVTAIGPRDESNELHSSAMSNPSVLWGAAAAAMAGAVTAYAVEEKRKQEKERASQAADAADQEERRAKMQARQTEKQEAKRAQEKAWEEARAEQKFEKLNAATTFSRLDADADEEWVASQATIQKRYEEHKKAQEHAYYAAMRQRVADKLKSEPLAVDNSTIRPDDLTPKPKESWWQKTWRDVSTLATKTVEWVDQHQKEVALGVGLVVGVGAILLSGGIATPMVALGWTLGAAAVAAGTVAAGTVALNKHYGRDWNANLLTNVAIAGGSALAVTGAWFVFQIGSTSIGAYCVVNPVICSRVDPIFKTIDAVEETWLNAKLTYQTWRGDEAGAVDTAFEIHSEQMDGGMPGNSLSKELREQLAKLGQDAVNLIRKHGTEVVPLLAKYGDAGLEIIQKYGDDGIVLLKLYGDDAVKLISEQGQDAVNLLQTYGQDAIPLLKTYKTHAVELTTRLTSLVSNDAFRDVLRQGPDAVTALAYWTDDELIKYGDELVARATSDAKALNAASRLAMVKDLQSPEAKELLKIMAQNSIQGSGNRIILGKWVDGSFDDGFIGAARASASRFYGPSRGLEKAFEGLSPAEKENLLWAVNQQALQEAVDADWQIDYSFDGIDADVLNKEIAAIEAIASNNGEEVFKIFGRFPFRMREIEFLVEQGYTPKVDMLTNMVYWNKP